MGIIGIDDIDVSYDQKKAPSCERFLLLAELLKHQLVEFLHKLRGIFQLPAR